MNIDKILESGDVERFHMCTGMTKQCNSEHQWGVALLVQHFDKNCRKEVILAALTHDVAELVTGDIPATTKWANPELRVTLETMEHKVEEEWGIRYNLTPVEKHLLKTCDMFEGMLYCIKRVKMGEVKAHNPFQLWAGHIEKNYLPLTSCDIHMTNIQEKFYNNMLKQMSQLETHHGS